MRRALAVMAGGFWTFAAAHVAFAASDISNNYLLSINPSGQAGALGEAVGSGCEGRAAFYMGIDETGLGKDKAFWSVRCSDGREFAVEVNTDGTSAVFGCAASKALNSGTCFKTFNPSPNSTP